MNAMNNSNKIKVKNNEKNVLMKYGQLTILMFCCFFAVSSLQAQTAVEDFEYKPGQFEINAGIGLMSTYVGSQTSTKIPPLSVILNYRILKHNSVGAYFGYSSTGYKLEDDKKGSGSTPQLIDMTNNFYLTGLRIQGHYNSGRADIYGGAMFGYNFSTIDANIDDPSQLPDNLKYDGASLFTYSGFIGVKYLVTQHIGLYGEIGYGASLINLGASYRF